MQNRTNSARRWFNAAVIIMHLLQQSNTTQTDCQPTIWHYARLCRSCDTEETEAHGSLKIWEEVDTLTLCEPRYAVLLAKARCSPKRAYQLMRLCVMCGNESVPCCSVIACSWRQAEVPISGRERGYQGLIVLLFRSCTHSSIPVLVSCVTESAMAALFSLCVSCVHVLRENTQLSAVDREENRETSWNHCLC